MGYSKPFVLFTLLFIVTVFISSHVSAHDLAEAKPESVEDAKYGGYGGYGHGSGGYGHGGGGYGGGGYGHGGGGYGGGGYGHGGGGGYGHGGYGHGGYGGHYPPKAEKAAQENGN